MLLIALASACTGDAPEAPALDVADVWTAGPALPQPISNNAVAAVELGDVVSVFSFLGMDSTKVWTGVTNAAYRWDVGDPTWRELTPVPGPGRLAPTAEVIDGLIYVVGGYTVAEDGSERSMPNLDIYDPGSDSWSRGADIPVPADDAVSGVWGDSVLVLVSGWHDGDNVPDVQIYDPAADSWSASTPIPGPPVFGHTGTVAGDHVVYVDGAAVVEGSPRFQLAPGSWEGRLEGGGVEWGAVEAHPGPALYRAAGGTVGTWAVFIGGTDNPYNYNGVGYDSVPAEPLRQVLAYSPVAREWRALAAPPEATMDHRTFGVAGGRVFLVGGIVEGQRVSGHTWVANVEQLLASIF